MTFIISKVDKRLDIPKKMRGIFPNEERLIIILPAGQPVDVPDYVAKYYTKNRPQNYNYADKHVPDDEYPQSTVTESFDALKFLEDNYSMIEEALKSLKRKELLAVGYKLGLKGLNKQKDNRVMERIVGDVNIKNAHQKELEKHKAAK